MNDNNKMYFFKVPKKTESGLDDFLRFSETYLESFPEVPNTAETVGSFIRDYMGKSLDFIPALVVENAEGWMIEYYVFDNPETVKHEKINCPSDEDQKTLFQVSRFRKALENAFSLGTGGDVETTETDLFFNSSFEIGFNDKVSGKRYNIDLYMCAGHFDLICDLLKEVEKIAKE